MHTHISTLQAVWMISMNIPGGGGRKHVSCMKREEAFCHREEDVCAPPLPPCTPREREGSVEDGEDWLAVVPVSTLDGLRGCGSLFSTKELGDVTVTAWSPPSPWTAPGTWANCSGSDSISSSVRRRGCPCLEVKGDTCPAWTHVPGARHWHRHPQGFALGSNPAPPAAPHWCVSHVPTSWRLPGAGPRVHLIMGHFPITLWARGPGVCQGELLTGPNHGRHFSECSQVSLLLLVCWELATLQHNIYQDR